MASNPTTVHVTGISDKTSEKEVRDFFSFCGKISNLSTTTEQGGKQSAAVTFEKPTAAKVSNSYLPTPMNEKMLITAYRLPFSLTTPN